jgi:hypothetical protein
MSDHIEHRIKGNAEKYVKKVFKVIFIGILIIILIALFGYVTMRLWNWLMPEIFGLGQIGYWQALGIIVLAKIFFGGFGDHKSNKRTKNSSSRCRPKYNKGFKKDFSNWKYYDKFWQEEGEKAFEEYVGREQEENDTP